MVLTGAIVILAGARAAWMGPTELSAQQASDTSTITRLETAPARKAKNLLPPSFRVHETRRFTVLSDADLRWTRLQGERLERAAHQFERVMRRLGIEPGPQRHNLLCILFDDYHEYLHFASTYDNVQARWVAGYYSTKHDWIVFYNMDSSPDVDNARKNISVMKKKVEDLKNELHRARRRGDRDRVEVLGLQLEQQREHVRSESRRVDEFTDDVIVATIIHEAIHQLAFHTGVQRSDVQYPIWINEGLATAFETATPNHAFGPDHEYEPRRNTFREHLSNETLLPLQELVQITSLRDADVQTVSAVYHQSYALVTWMMRARRSELRKYLELMQDAPAGAADSATHLKWFEQAFGEIDRVEHAWLRYERGSLR